MNPHSARISRNRGIALDLGWVNQSYVDEAAIQSQVAFLSARTSALEKASLLNIVRCLDLTTLNGDDTPGTVNRLCAEAKHPLPEQDSSLEGLHVPIKVSAVCVYHEFVATAVQALQRSGVAVAAVSGGFPHGLSPLEVKLLEIGMSIQAGAKEIDVVIPRHLVLAGDWSGLYRQVSAMRQECGQTHMKTILSTGELGSLENVAKASLVCLMAGSDFIKTSTGKEAVNARLDSGLSMAHCIREYRDRTGFAVGLKAAGGIRTSVEATRWLHLVEQELGARWLEPDLFRLGASSLLSDIRDQLVLLNRSSPTQV